MSDDPAVLQHEAPAVEPAPATSGPAGVTHVLGSLLRNRIGLSPLAGWLLVSIAAVGLLASTPPSAGPDEPFQQATAWYLSGHGLPPDDTTLEYSVPESLVVTPCYAFHSDQNRRLYASRQRGHGHLLIGPQLPTAVFLVVGGGERLAALVGLQYAADGGRIASLLLNLGVLLLLTFYMRRRNRLWGNFLLVVSTPMAVFLGVVVNPSGWEITCGLAMAVVLARPHGSPVGVRVRGLAEEDHSFARPHKCRPVHSQTPRVPLGCRSDRLGHRIGTIATQTRPATHCGCGRSGDRRGGYLVSHPSIRCGCADDCPRIREGVRRRVHVFPAVHP